MVEKGYFAILQDPSRVYNGDEICFQFCPQLGKVIAPLGTKSAYEVNLGDARQNLTVMFTFSAVGDTIPPLIIFPNKRLPKAVSSSVPGEWGIVSSDNGWMTADVFIGYIDKVLYPYLKNKIYNFLLFFS